MKKVNLRKIAQKLQDELQADPNFFSVGIAEGANKPLVIYTRKKVKGYPLVYEGVNVEVVKVGKVQIKRAKDGGI